MYDRAILPTSSALPDSVDKALFNQFRALLSAPRVWASADKMHVQQENLQPNDKGCKD